MAHSVLENAAEHESIVRRGRRLAYWTLVCTGLEAAAALVAAAQAGSTALAGFGADSLIEVFSALVVLWRLMPGPRGEQREQRALRLVGASLLALAAYVTWKAIAGLAAGTHPENSWLGLAVAVFSLVAMQWLARGKRRVAAELESGAVRADSEQSRICSYLAAILLVGLGVAMALELVVGRFGRRAGDGSADCPRGVGCLAGRGVRLS